MRHLLIITSLLLCASATMGNTTPRAETAVWNHGTEEKPADALDKVLRRQPLLTELEEDLAFKMALVSANEGALWTLYTVPLIHQVVVTNVPYRDGEIPDSMLKRRVEFLEKHSGRVMGVKPCPKSGNCRWVRNLSKTATTLPAGIASGKGGPKNWKNYWRVVMAPRWKRVMGLSRAMIAGSMEAAPCPIPPRTWGSVKTHMPDVRVAEGNGLYPIGCEGTGNNDGFAPLSRFPFWHMKGMDAEW